MTWSSGLLRGRRPGGAARKIQTAMEEEASARKDFRGKGAWRGCASKPWRISAVSERGKGKMPTGA